jgi:hypothetical protein
MRTRWRTRASVLVATALALTWGVQAAGHITGPGDGATSGDFFIISSVDPAKSQLLLKLPTEVTEVMRVGDETRYIDEDGKSMKLTDLRAGDTVYITSRPGRGGLVAIQIRRGPMTVTELRRRYLQRKK